MFAHGYGFAFHFFFADDEHVGYFFEFGIANFAADFFVPLIHFAAQAQGGELCYDFFGVIQKAVADGQNDELCGCEPKREIAACVFDKYAYKALHRAKGCAVDHHRAMWLVVGADVLQLEALGQVVIHLYGAQLPGAAEGIFDHEVEFGAVESGFAQFRYGFQACFLYGFDDGAFGLFPVFFRADVLFGIFGIAQGDLHGIVFEAQFLKHVARQFQHIQELAFDLIGSAKDVGVVLGEAPHAGEAVQLTTLLVAIDGAEFCDAQGQVFVRAGPVAEDFAVVGAVHRLEQELLPFFRGVDGLKTVFAVLSVVAGGYVQLFLAEMRRDDRLIAPFELLLLEEVFEAGTQLRTFG